MENNTRNTILDAAMRIAELQRKTDEEIERLAGIIAKGFIHDDKAEDTEPKAIDATKKGRNGYGVNSYLNGSYKETFCTMKEAAERYGLSASYVSYLTKNMKSVNGVSFFKCEKK